MLLSKLASCLFVGRKNMLLKICINSCWNLKRSNFSDLLWLFYFNFHNILMFHFIYVRAQTQIQIHGKEKKNHLIMLCHRIDNWIPFQGTNVSLKTRIMIQKIYHDLLSLPLMQRNRKNTNVHLAKLQKLLKELCSGGILK